MPIYKVGRKVVVHNAGLILVKADSEQEAVREALEFDDTGGTCVFDDTDDLIDSEVYATEVWHGEIPFGYTEILVDGEIRKAEEVTTDANL